MSNEATAAKPSLLAHESRLNRVEEAVAGLASAVSELQNALGAAKSDLPSTVSDAERNAWVDHILHKFFAGEKPALELSDGEIKPA